MLHCAKQPSGAITRNEHIKGLTRGFKLFTSQARGLELNHNGEKEVYGERRSNFQPKIG